MKKLVLAVVLPILLVASAMLALAWWERGAPPWARPEAVPVTVDTISRENRGVQIEGTAHYDVKLTQKAGEETWYLFPLFAPKDTTGREIKVVVRTKRKPDDLYSFEERTIEGFARPPGRMFPLTAQEQMRSRGYVFSEKFVLVEEFDD